jgi:D-glycero-D-manno-heptose 1,7-bisphosphate phosphatase
VSGERRAAVFLDRDGVLIRAPVVDGAPQSIRDVSSLELEPWARESCDELGATGLALVCVTNQPDVARGLLAPAELERIHARLRALLPLDEVVVCPHDDADRCSCRKPLPGMLVDAAERHALDLAASVMVGDTWRDVEAGRSAGCATVLLERDYSESVRGKADVVVRDLREAASWILAARRER